MGFGSKEAILRMIIPASNWWLILFQERDDMFIMSTLACQHVTQHNNISFSRGKSIRICNGHRRLLDTKSRNGIAMVTGF
jgi:hypothetical protein